ncbi:MAG: hypothetical protein AAFV07_06185, partial [Bacteroidota bacterium]
MLKSATPVILLLLWSPLLLFPASNPDSLRQIWLNADLPDSSRFEALELLALNLGNNDSATHYLTRMQEEAAAQKLPSWQIKALQRLANVQFETSNYEAAEASLQEVLDLSKKHRFTREEGLNTILLGRLYLEMGHAPQGD